MSQPTRPHPRTGALDTSRRGACRGRGWGYPRQSDASCPGNVHARVGSQYGGVLDAARVFHIQLVTGTDSKKRDRSSPPSGSQGSSMKRTRPLSSASTSIVGSSAHSSPHVHESPLSAVSGVVDAGADLFWSREGDLSDQLFPETAVAPFIVLMESTIPGRNLGKYDFIAIADLIDEVIDGERVIRRNGQNQCKIICEAREEANTLILSVDLKFAGYKLFIPSSLLRKKAFTRDVEPGYAPKDIVDRLDLKSRDIVTSARRRTNKDGSLTDTMRTRWSSPWPPARFAVSFL